MEIIEEAHRMKQEELAFHRWAVSYQEMIPFEEFKQKLGMHRTLNMQSEDNQTPEEILQKVEGILNGNI